MGMRNKAFSGKLAITLGIICIILTSALAGTITTFMLTMSEKDKIITGKDSTINNLNSQIIIKESQITEYNDTISLLSSQISQNQNTISSLDSQISNQASQIVRLTSEKDQLQAWLDSNVTTLDSQIADLQNQNNISNSHISTLQNQALLDQSEINNFQDQVTAANVQISNLSSIVTTLQNQVSTLTEMISINKQKLQTIVFHVCDKGEGYTWGGIPDANNTYNEILSLYNNSCDVLLLPEYKGNENWTETFVWLNENFVGIPIMLPIYEAGPYDYPVEQLSTDQISEAMAVLDIRSVRIFEVVSWCIDHNMTFPTEYVRDILTFCRENNLTVFWSEWKVGDNVFQNIKSYIAGFEDIVTVSFSTNSGELEPAEGFELVSELFQHWGGSVQPWYLTTRTGEDLMNMPASLLIQHALSAIDFGAEILQFEPYWYFFNNGQATENLKLILTMLNLVS